MKNNFDVQLIMDVELAKGMTWEHKLKKLCPHFEHMLELYGERANINPLVFGVWEFVGMNKSTMMTLTKRKMTNLRMTTKIRQDLLAILIFVLCCLHFALIIILAYLSLCHADKIEERFDERCINEMH